MTVGAKRISGSAIRALAIAASLVGAASVAPAAFADAKATLDEVDPGQPVSEISVDLAAWVIATKDNLGRPFAVIDKAAAQVLVFDGKGRLQGLAPVLIGSSVGDLTAQGVVDRELRDIPMNHRTTPAGGYYGAYGPAAGGQRVLWVDFESAISIHPVSDTTIGEQRKKRLASPTVEDNRITHGCINVSETFYTGLVQPVFAEKGGMFYILPDWMPAEEAFPGFKPPNLVMAQQR